MPEPGDYLGVGVEAGLGALGETVTYAPLDGTGRVISALVVSRDGGTVAGVGERRVWNRIRVTTRRDATTGVLVATAGRDTVIYGGDTYIVTGVVNESSAHVVLECERQPVDTSGMKGRVRNFGGGRH